MTDFEFELQIRQHESGSLATECENAFFLALQPPHSFLSKQWVVNEVARFGGGRTCVHMVPTEWQRNLTKASLIGNHSHSSHG